MPKQWVLSRSESGKNHPFHSKLCFPKMRKSVVTDLQIRSVSSRCLEKQEGKLKNEVLRLKIYDPSSCCREVPLSSAMQIMALSPANRIEFTLLTMMIGS
ncbi:hypothetical protein CEXT_719211 [Caerostris extrusa]|uniref:Uncharacterized protein n=1 Tax=Caerostris extrusa TaxID=172846 RepID=A0AAV4QTQ3_CAEEX|nr:hypothetical protein CEXT_719211 [Caerostris extrusa]